MKVAIFTVLVCFVSFTAYAYDPTEGEDSVPTVTKAKSKDQDLKKLIQDGRYDVALVQLDKVAIAESHIGIKIVYDVLFAVVNGDKVSVSHEFFCEPQYQTYPNAVAYSYSMKICKSLLDYKEKKSISSQSYEELQKFVKKNSKHKLYLVEALQVLVK